MNNNIKLGVVPNYLIDVNCKIAYNSNSALPPEIYDTERFTTDIESSTEMAQFITGTGETFYVRAENLDYFITKQITYPLGLDNTPQTIEAIQIYESGNLVGGND
jgi:hypothetical protein